MKHTIFSFTLISLILDNSKKDSYDRKVFCPIAVNAWSSTQKLETTYTEYKQYARFYDSILHELQIYPEQPM